MDQTETTGAVAGGAGSEAFAEMERLLRAAVSAVGLDQSVVLRVSDGFEIDGEDVSVLWARDATPDGPGWRVCISYSEIDYGTDEAQRHENQPVAVFATGDEYAAAQSALFQAVRNWMDAEMADA